MFIKNKWTFTLVGIPFVGIVLLSIPFSFLDDLKGLNSFKNNAIFAFQQENNLAITLREKTQQLLLKVPKMDSDAKIYFISQNSTGFEKYMFNYLALPLESNSRCWSIGVQYYEGDVWTCDEDINQLLTGFSFVVIFNADRQFWDANIDILETGTEPKSSGVYLIKSSEGGLKLSEIKEQTEVQGL